LLRRTERALSAKSGRGRRPCRTVSWRQFGPSHHWSSSGASGTSRVADDLVAQRPTRLPLAHRLVITERKTSWTANPYLAQALLQRRGAGGGRAFALEAPTL